MPRTTVSHPIFARVYQRASKAMDRNGAAHHCARLLTGLSLLSTNA